MNNLNIIDSFFTLLSLLIELTIIGFCIYYVVKSKSIDGILLLISSIMSILLRPANALFINYMTLGNITNIEKAEFFGKIIQIYGLVSYSLFAIGLILMILKLVKNKQNLV